MSEKELDVAVQCELVRGAAALATAAMQGFGADNEVVQTAAAHFIKSAADALKSALREHDADVIGDGEPGA